MSEQEKAFAFSVLAVVVSGSFLLFSGIIIDTGGNYGPIHHRHLGYWLWFSSTIVMSVGNGIQLIGFYRQRNREETLLGL